MEPTETSSQDEFMKVMTDFYKDILTTFPECKEHCTFELLNDLNNKNYSEDVQMLYDHCLKIYPEMFFDILYQNNEIFEDASKNTMFLPDIEFKKLWQEDISDKTREIIWKYLQMILFIVINDVKDKNSFGDTAKLFEAINEDEFKQKLEDTITEMSSFFDMSGMKDMSNMMGMDMSGMEDMSNMMGMDMSGMMNGMMGMDMSGMSSDALPDAEKLHEHINKLLEGKLGRLAAEIAEETATDLNLDLSNNSNIGDVFQNLFKNPGKLMNMVKKVGSKLDEKIKSGEINEKEIMEEASELMNSMKDMDGMKNMNKMFNQMGLGKNKVNFNAMQSQLKRNISQSKQKERMLKKLEERRKQRKEMEELKKKKEEEIKKNNLENMEHIKYTGDGKIEKSKRKRKKKKKRKGKK